MSNIRSLNSQPSFWDFVSDFAAQQSRQQPPASNNNNNNNDWRQQSRDTFLTEDTLIPDDDFEMGGGAEHPQQQHDGSTEKPHDEAGPSQPHPKGRDSRHDERSSSRSRSRSRSPRGRRHGHRHGHGHGPHGMRHGPGGHHHGGPHPHGPPPHMHGPGHHFGGGRGGGGFRGRGGCPRGWGGPWGGFGRYGPFGQHPWASAYGGNGGGGPFDVEKLAEYFNAAASMFNQHVAGGSRGANANADTSNNAGTEDFRPQMDLFDTPSSYIVHVSLPGAKREDVVVNWKADTQSLEVAGVVYRPGVDEQMNSMLELGEREVGVFARSVKLGTPEKPAGVDEEGIAAKLEDGVLRVEVPKLKEAEFVQVRRVDVM